MACSASFGIVNIDIIVTGRDPVIKMPERQQIILRQQILPVDHTALPFADFHRGRQQDRMLAPGHMLP